MNQPMSGGPAAPATGSRTSARAVWALVLGILGIVCCILTGPVAWYLGAAEVKAVDAGLSSAESRGMALAGMILGIVGTVLLVLTVIWVLLFGGMAVIGGMAQELG